MSCKEVSAFWLDTGAPISLLSRGRRGLAAALRRVACRVKSVGETRWTVLVLRETFTVPMAIGFVLVIAGSMLAARRRQAEAPGPTPAPA
jgi:drug/metabolite transporter (DMT)-like permease